MKKQNILFLTFLLSFSSMACSTQDKNLSKKDDEKTERTVAEKRIERMKNFGDRLGNRK